MRENGCLQSPFTAYLCGTAEVIVIDLFYCLEVDHTLQLGLMFVCGRENNVGLFKKAKKILTATDFSWLEKPRRITSMSPRITTGRTHDAVIKKKEEIKL